MNISSPRLCIAFVLAAFAMPTIPTAAQTIPVQRRVDWTIAGAADTSTAGYQIIDCAAAGFNGDGVTPNDDMMDSLLQREYHPGAILIFPAGHFLFHRTIRLSSDRVLRGAGAGATRLIFDLGGSGHAITVVGRAVSSDSRPVTGDAQRGTRTLSADSLQNFSAGDWIYLSQRDDDRVTSDWALGRTGQLLRIEQSGDTALTLSSRLRQRYEAQRNPVIMRVEMRRNVGIECLAIERHDDTAPQQSSSVFFRYAADCWLYGVASHRCTFAHVTAEFCSNVSVRSSYFHDAFDFGGGGRGYGVVLQFATGECRIEDNIFERLRHAMLLQAGANGNVFACNYSIDPYWTGTLTPADAAGDMVLHGNYPYANLFEHNICRNIVIDNSHGPNGPFNTFFRNRADGYGIFFSADNSPSCNIIGNEITNTTLPYRLVNYTIRGDDHLLHGNSVRGSIEPVSGVSLPDSSYAYTGRPEYLVGAPFPSIGIPHAAGSGSIPAEARYRSGAIVPAGCRGNGMNAAPHLPSRPELTIYPNPARENIVLISSPALRDAYYVLRDILGRAVTRGRILRDATTIPLTRLPRGMYFILAGDAPPHSIIVE